MKQKRLTFEEKYNWFKKDIEDNYKDEYEFIDFYYIIDNSKHRNKGIIKVKHKICGQTFTRVACQWKTNKNCQYCSNMMSVSKLHAIISIIAKHEYPNSKNEYDIGFLGKNNGHSKYDLFIPCLNGFDTIIEFQSRFHNGKEDFDFQKKTYAENKGYYFLSFDSRTDYPKDVCKKLFNIDYIPKYVYNELSMFYKNDSSICQQYLDKNLSVSEISKITKIPKSVIFKDMASGKLKVLDDRKKITHGKTPVVQLDLYGNYINEYDSSYDVYKKMNIRVDSVLRGNTKTCNGFVWVSKDKYINNDYILPKRAKIKNKFIYIKDIKE